MNPFKKEKAPGNKMGKPGKIEIHNSTDFRNIIFEIFNFFRIEFASRGGGRGGGGGGGFRGGRGGAGGGGGGFRGGRGL